MLKTEILKKYKNTEIGKTNLNQIITAESIANKDNLKIFLYGIYGPQDESLSREGLDFLKEYYGLDSIAELILTEKEKGLDYHFSSKAEVVDWLEKSVI